MDRVQGLNRDEVAGRAVRRRMERDAIVQAMLCAVVKLEKGGGESRKVVDVVVADKGLPGSN